MGEITLRRRGPESLPDSTFLVGLLLGIYLLTSVVYLLIHGSLDARNLASLAAQIVLLFGFVFAILTFFRLERRYRQTVSAILGINIVILCFYFPFAFAGLLLDYDLLMGQVFLWLRLGLFLWSVIVEASIFSRALSQPLILGFMFEILYVLPSLSISEFFAPPAE